MCTMLKRRHVPIEEVIYKTYIHKCKSAGLIPFKYKKWFNEIYLQLKQPDKPTGKETPKAIKMLREVGM